MLSDAARKLSDEAKSKGLWLYDPEYKWWYSPEQFAHNFHYANATDEFLSRVQIRHPLEGIEAGFKMLANTQTNVELFIKLEVFTKKVVNYYKK